MLKRNLFDLSEEELALSKTMYNGKIIKCLVAPYHTYDQLKNDIECTPTTYLFPERDAGIQQLSHLISIIVNSDKEGEFCIVTTNMNVIMDMVDGCVRVLTEECNVVPSPCKTFMANIHTLRYELLENKAHQVSDEKRQEGKEIINVLIKEVNDARENGATRTEIENLRTKTVMIGEELISNRLLDMILSISINDKYDYIELKKDLKKLSDHANSDKFEESFKFVEKMFKQIPADVSDEVNKELKKLYTDAIQNRINHLNILKTV